MFIEVQQVVKLFLICYHYESFALYQMYKMIMALYCICQHIAYPAIYSQRPTCSLNQPWHRPVKSPYWATTNSDGGDLQHRTLYQPYSNVLFQ